MRLELKSILICPSGSVELRASVLQAKGRWFESGLNHHNFLWKGNIIIMKKIFIDAPLDYVTGHLRYGHLEGIVEMTDEEFERFKEDPINFFYDNEYECNRLDLIIDDFEVDDRGPINEVNWEERS